MKVEHGISARADGSMLVAQGDRVLEDNARHRAAFFKKKEIGHHAVCRLAHGTKIQKITPADDGQIIWNVDGLITRERDFFLCLTVADCLPVYFWDEEGQAVGIAHAGWRGLLAGILPKMVQAFRDEFSISPATLLAAIGPGIHQCHFEVKEDFLPEFEPYSEHVLRENDKIFVDLYGIAQEQLGKAGLLPQSVSETGECTYCLADKYFSHRREAKESPIDVQMAYIGRRA